MTVEEQLRAEIATLKQQHLEFCGDVHSRAHSIATTIGIERPHDAALEALDLCTRAANRGYELQMQQERSGQDRYNLAALVVSTDTPSNSESGRWERDE